VSVSQLDESSCVFVEYLFQIDLPLVAAFAVLNLLILATFVGLLTLNLSPRLRQST
jgi:hypothetical protein